MAMLDENRPLLNDLAVVSRLPETLGYNVAYLAIAFGLAVSAEGIGLVIAHRWLVLVGFIAVMLSKIQASLADVIHDRELDRKNHAKTRIPAALDRIGIDNTATLLMLTMVVAMGAWGWIAQATGMAMLLGIGTAANGLGFIYTYPPRIKERGILNHITTTAVDMACVWVFFVLATGGGMSTADRWDVLLAVGLYAFGYHIVHQAADTYYDRIYGISTFTQTIGPTRSMWLATVTTAIAAGITILVRVYVASAVLIVTAIAYAVIAYRIRDKTVRGASDLISSRFNIGVWAAILNTAMAFGLFF